MLIVIAYTGHSVCSPLIMETTAILCTLKSCAKKMVMMSYENGKLCWMGKSYLFIAWSLEIMPWVVLVQTSLVEFLVKIFFRSFTISKDLYKDLLWVLMRIFYDLHLCPQRSCRILQRSFESLPTPLKILYFEGSLLICFKWQYLYQHFQCQGMTKGSQGDNPWGDCYF